MDSLLVASRGRWIRANEVSQQVCGVRKLEPEKEGMVVSITGMSKE